MAKLKEIWIENHDDSNPAIRIDWDNDYHEKVELQGANPLHVMEALMVAALRIESALHKNKI